MAVDLEKAGNRTHRDAFQMRAYHNSSIALGQPTFSNPFNESACLFGGQFVSGTGLERFCVNFSLDEPKDPSVVSGQQRTATRHDRPAIPAVEVLYLEATGKPSQVSHCAGKPGRPKFGQSFPRREPADCEGLYCGGTVGVDFLYSGFARRGFSERCRNDRAFQSEHFSDGCAVPTYDSGDFPARKSALG
jgi:hypothetical protein